MCLVDFRKTVGSDYFLTVGRQIEISFIISIRFISLILIMFKALFIGSNLEVNFSK